MRALASRHPPRTRPRASEGGDAHPRGMAQPLDLARLLRRERVQPSVGRREPDGRSDLGPTAAECREAHVAMPLELELADVGHGPRFAGAYPAGTGATRGAG